MMAIKNNKAVPYKRGSKFSKRTLSSVNDRDVYKYFCKLAYGKFNPTADDNPTGCRNSTLIYAKKSISWFIPNNNCPWNEDTHSGNPTKSIIILNLLTAVKKRG